MISRRTPLWGYLTAQAISLAGTRVSMIAIPWFVLSTTGSAVLTGLVAFAEMGPLVVLQALSGPLIDRIGARRVALTCDAGSVLAVGLVPTLHLAGLLTFPVLLALVAVAGALRGPGEAATEALVPQLVEHADVPTERLTGLAGAVERSASLVGAAIAGGLVALIGGADALVVDAASFGVAGLVLARSTRWVGGVSTPLTARAPEGADRPTEQTSYLAELRAGWDFMRKDVVLIGIGVMVALTNLLDQAWFAVLLPVWARASGNGVAAVGLLAAVFSATAIAGSVTAAAYAARLPRYWTYVIAFMVGGVPRFVVMALPSPLWLVLGIAAIGGYAAGFLNPVLGAVIFERIPAAMVGRVSSLSNAMSWSLIPFGGLLGGLCVASLGISPALLVVGAAYLATTMLPVVQPRWRQLDDRPAPPAQTVPDSEATKSSLSSTGAGITNG